MKRHHKWFWVALSLAVIGGGVGLFVFLHHGISARDKPTAVEAFLAKHIRHLAVPWKARNQINPVKSSPEILTRGLEHFADHCALCHANDGSGQTTIGRNLYPKAPDMRLFETQKLSDGELYYIIENGIRLTGMPAWGTGKKDDKEETWGLVHFIRHLPMITPEELAEMEKLNPRSPNELEEEKEEKTFLEGGNTNKHKGRNHP